MKKNIIFSVLFVIGGLLISLGPVYLFKACATGCCSSYPDCYWMKMIELGMGMIITALGTFLIVYTDPKIQIGMIISIILTDIMVLLIPTVIIGTCAIKTMACNVLTVPVLIVIGVFLLICSAIRILSLRKTISAT